MDFLHDPDIVDDFVGEATERLDRVGDLALEAEGGSDESWRELRREIHTLKGAAGCLGLDGFSDVCHELEAYMLRCEQGAARVQLFDLLHDACDLLREWVEQVVDCCRDGSELPIDPRGAEVTARLRAAAA